MILDPASNVEFPLLVAAAVLDWADVLDVQGGEGRVFLSGLAKVRRTRISALLISNEPHRVLLRELEHISGLR